MDSPGPLSVLRVRMTRCADQLRAWRAVLHYEPCCPRATKRTLAAAAVTAAATAVLLLAAILVWRRPAAEPGAECRTRDTGQVARLDIGGVSLSTIHDIPSAACSPSRTRGSSTAPAPRRTTAAWPGAAPPRTTGGDTWPGGGATASRSVPWVGCTLELSNFDTIFGPLTMMMSKLESTTGCVQCVSLPGARLQDRVGPEGGAALRVPLQVGGARVPRLHLPLQPRRALVRHQHQRHQPRAARRVGQLRGHVSRLPHHARHALPPPLQPGQRDA